ncbi:RND family efflux transporter MFP subunit [Pseudoduganella flava]|uniref:Efflux RND transporter periplasmic adaptor subunit n=1 Tax=Pseudoduganella flava TaxID=871742 RepID=A0A562PIY9_9BURK|nr:efflux RND transporter periplasmic adaptor subunit [Pseudoduganella flava]QGZ41898.1 efflux RND transporter periplasmic adaptor subunit [Pseudoduganella flava]TWI44303.1 RND family efflux transporter MFP subunit [Pseudoduganella flava]
MLRNTLLAIAVATSLVACGKPPQGPDQAGKGDDKKTTRLLVAPEDLLTVQANSLASGPVITGSIQPERRADMRAEVSAIVLQVLKENGDPVKKGDLLVRLDDTSIRDSLSSSEEAVRNARQVVDQAQRMLERNKTLRASGMTSMQALEDAEVRLNTAQSELAAAKARAVSARQQLDRTQVRAPFDGIVSDRKVSNGDTAQIGKELVKVIDPHSMRFEGKVSADKIGVVKVGQPVLFRVNGYPGQNFQGVVKRVDPAANPVTRQVEVLVAFSDQIQPRVAGLYAEGRVESESTNALMLPASAMVQAGDDRYVWRVKDNKLSKVNLAVGARDERTGQWQVTRGLAAGDMVLRAPGSTVHDGQPVQLVTPKNVASANGTAKGN